MTLKDEPASRDADPDLFRKHLTRAQSNVFTLLIFTYIQGLLLKVSSGPSATVLFTESTKKEDTGNATKP